MIASTAPISMASRTDATASRTSSAWSYTALSRTPGGSDGAMALTISATLSAIATVLPFNCRVTLINVTRQLNGNTVAIADSVAEIVRAIAPSLPPGVRLKAVYDQAELVRDAVASVRDAMLIGAVLAIIVLLIFLRHGRITAISASSIPLTMAVTVFVMWLFGQTFNLMTLGAMAIAIGLVIDDAVVVTENIA